MSVRLVSLLIAAVTLLAACRTLPPPLPERPPEFPDGWRVIDVTRPLDADAAYAQHDEAFPFDRLDFATPPGSDWQNGAIATVEQLGTHVAAPRARDPDGNTVEVIPARRLLAPVVVIDAPAGSAEAVLTADAIRVHERVHGHVPDHAVVVLRTGQGALPPTDPRFAGRALVSPRHAGWAPDGVEFLVANRRVAAVGTDAMTLDPGAVHAEAPAQKVAAHAGLWAVVGLADIRSLPPRGAYLLIGVLPVEGGTGAPARILALIPPKGSLLTPSRTAEPASTR